MQAFGLENNSNYTPHKFLSNKIQTLYNHKNTSMDDDANSVIQTSDGYLWFSSYSGLYRFNGNKLKRIQDKNFSSSSIRTLFESSEHELFVGSNDNGVYRFRNNSIYHYPQTQKSKLSVSIRDILEDKYRDIYVLTTSGIGIIKSLHPKTSLKAPLENISFSRDNNISYLNIIDKNNQPLNKFFLKGAIDNKNYLWTVTNSGELFKIDLKTLKAEKYRSKDNIEAILYNKKTDTIIISTTNNILYLNPVDMSLKKTVEANKLQRIKTLFLDKKDTLWVGGRLGFGFITDKNKFHPIKNSLATTNIESIFQDYEGNYWIASNAHGILKISPNRYTNIFSDNSITPSRTNATLIKNNILYVGTDNGLIIIGKKGVIKNKLTRFLRGNKIRHIAIDTNNNLWFSVYGKLGVVKYDTNNKITTINHSNGLTNNKVRQIVPLANNKLLVATTQGLNILKKDKVIKTITQKDGLENEYILTITNTKKGTYLGTDGGGIFFLDNNLNITNICKKYGIKPQVILRTIFDPIRQTLFISYAGKLHILHSNGNYEIFSRSEINGRIYSFNIYNDRLILVTHRGIYSANLNEMIHHSKPKIVKYSQKNKVNALATPNSWNYLNKDGNIYLSTTAGVLYLNLNHIQKNAIPPKIAIDEISVDGKSYNPKTNNIYLDAKANTLTIDLSVLSFINSSGNTYNYKLDGIDATPQVISNLDANKIIYTNLKGGTYHFSFWANNSDGTASSDILKLTISKDKSWQEYLPQIIIISFFILIIIGILLYLTNKNKLNLSKNKTKRYMQLSEQLAAFLASIINHKNKDKPECAQKIAEYSLKIASKLDYTKEELEQLKYAALLHNIGRLASSIEPLDKSNKSHTHKGFAILKQLPLAKDISAAALLHHEYFDGTGYPLRLFGVDTPEIIRIIILARFINKEIIAQKLAHNKFNQDLLVKKLQLATNKQLDPELVNIACELIENNLLI